MIPEIKTKITPLHSFIDEAFDAKKTASYQLLLQIGIDEIQVAIHDKQKNKYIALEKHTILSAYDFPAVADALDSLFKNSQLINHAFQSVVCTIVNNLSTLVPSALFEYDKKNMYLQFNASLEGDELVVIDELKNVDAKNIFALPLSIKKKLDALYIHVKYHHFSSALIDTIVGNNKNLSGKKMYLNIETTHFEVLVIDGKNLMFYNTFKYHSPEDFIYYLLFTCEQLHLNPEKTETFLLGEVEKSSDVYVLAQKYIRNLNFGARTANTDYSYQLQNIPKHFYFTLLNSYSA